MPAPLALVTRQRPDDVRASSFYLERALAPYPPGQHADGQRVQRIDPAAVDADALGAAELVILDHPGKLSDETIGLLAGLLKRGRAIWYLVAEPSDAVNLKQMTAGRRLGAANAGRVLAAASGPATPRFVLDRIERSTRPRLPFLATR